MSACANSGFLKFTDCYVIRGANVRFCNSRQRGLTSHSFMVAGHETTSTATMWCLFALTQAPTVQHKLRKELISVMTDSPTMDELMALPYIDMVVKESLRIHAPVSNTKRVAADDCVIPVGEPFNDRQGKLRNSIS